MARDAKPSRTKQGAARGKDAARKKKASPPDEAVYVGSSDIHGRGIFAARPLRKGDPIGHFEGEPTKRNGKFVLWVEDEDGEWEGRRGTTSLRFVNHDAEPNAEFDGWDLVALRRIRPDEEVTVDYGEDAP